jgi:hypothetical protein
MNAYQGKPENYDPIKVKDLLQTKEISSIANLEKAIFALEYVAQLQAKGLDFVFKGGSAVQILLGGQWNRLSVDADICTNASKDEIEQVVDSIKNQFDGVGFSYRLRGAELENKFTSYKLSTPQIIDGSRTILLDVQLIKPKYAIQTTKLEAFFYKSEISVQTPTISSILGDKLSVIGPNTIGRKLNDSRNGTEYAKHFYDINSLYNNLTNFKETKETYVSIIDIQEKIRGEKHQLSQCLDDALFTCQVACLPQGLGDQLIKLSDNQDKERASEEFEILQKGLTEFRPFIVSSMPYTWDTLRNYSSTVALLLKLIRMKASNEETMLLLKSKPLEESTLQDLVSQIEKIQKDQRWFIDLEEIIVFPEILEKWYKYYYLEELLGR